MKQCPRCSKTYTDEDLNFCLDDGEMLSMSTEAYPPTAYADDAPPTIILNNPRVTNPYNQPAAAPMQWQPPQQQNMQYRPYSPMQFAKSLDQTIPTIAMILGILSLPLACCYGGLWMGLPAMVLGFIGMRNADSDSSRYGGRGLAIAGLVMGGISFLATLGVIIVAVLAG